MIRRQNESLRENIKFTQQKEKQELALAAAQDDIARARIAQRVQSDPNFTEQDATEARRRLDESKNARETAASLAEEEAKIEAVMVRYKETAEQRQAVQERTAELERKQSEIELEFLTLQGKKLQQEYLTQKREQGLEDESTSSKLRDFFGRGESFFKPRDTVSQAAVDFAFTDDEKERLEIVEKQLSEINEKVSSSKSEVQDLTTKTFEIGQEVDNVTRSAESAKENVESLGALKGELLEVKAQTAATAAARETLATGAQDLRDQAERVADSNAIEAATFKETASQMDKILKNGVVSVTELKSIQGTLGTQSQALANAQSQGAALTRDLQRAVLEMQRKMTAMEQVQAQINSRTP